MLFSQYKQASDIYFSAGEVVIVPHDITLWDLIFSFGNKVDSGKNFNHNHSYFLCFRIFFHRSF